MKVMLVNGIDDDSKWTSHEDTLKALIEELKEEGLTVESFVVRDMKLNYCQGCWDCWTKTPGICFIKDDGEEYLKALNESDCILFCSPVKAGFITTETKKALDRFIPNIMPYISIYKKECHHLQRYPKQDKKLGIVLIDDGNITTKTSKMIFNNFDRIQKNMRIEKSIRFNLTTDNRKELVNEIINN